MAILTYPKGSTDQLSANFRACEFDCRGAECGCTVTLVDEQLVAYLQQIRDHFGAAVTITSGFRCAAHNKNVGGATASKHAQGMAADIMCAGVAPAEVAKYAESIGVLGIGLYETDADGHFVHIDTRAVKYYWYGQAQTPVDTFGGQLEEPVSRFADVAEDAWYAEAVGYVTKLGLMVGTGDGKFAPDRTVTRAELAAVTARVYRLLTE